MNIVKELYKFEDEKYAEFTAKLNPAIGRESVIGVRVPQLRTLAKEVIKNKEDLEFINNLPHKYLEENLLHGFIVSSIKDFDEAIYEVDRFLPYVNNWAVCDTFMPKCLKKNKKVMKTKIFEWIGSGHTYKMRFGLDCIMNIFLGDSFDNELMDLAAFFKSDEYYVNMMRAWLFATALAKNYDQTILYMQENKLDKWSHNKTIQKSKESFRVSDEHKEYLNSLKREN